MKYVLEIVTPEGTGKVAYGEFQPGDGRKKQYHCWWGGCGIGGRADILTVAEDYLKNFIIEMLRRRLDEYVEKETDIRIFLRSFTEDS